MLVLLWVYLEWQLMEAILLEQIKDSDGNILAEKKLTSLTFSGKLEKVNEVNFFST
jgi:hypothetical protein